MEIKVYKHNSVYRMGDIINATGIRWIEDRFRILSTAEYEGTILRHFLEHLIYLKPQDVAGFDYWETLQNITKNKAKEKKYRLPTENDIVMHLRLGDILAEKDESMWRIDEILGRFDRNQRRGPLNYYENFFKRMGLEKQYPEKEFKIVTALHFGANDVNNKYFYSDEAKEKSDELINSITEQLDELGRNYEIISQNTDADFAYMVHSKFFIKGLSGMSELVVQCLADDTTIIHEKRKRAPIEDFDLSTTTVNGAPAFKFQSNEYDKLPPEEQEYIYHKIRRDLGS